MSTEQQDGFPAQIPCQVAKEIQWKLKWLKAGTEETLSITLFPNTNQNNNNTPNNNNNSSTTNQHDTSFSLNTTLPSLNTTNNNQSTNQPSTPLYSQQQLMNNSFDKIIPYHTHFLQHVSTVLKYFTDIKDKNMNLEPILTQIATYLNQNTTNTMNNNNMNQSAPAHVLQLNKYHRCCLQIASINY